MAKTKYEALFVNESVKKWPIFFRKFAWWELFAAENSGSTKTNLCSMFIEFYIFLQNFVVVLHNNYIDQNVCIILLLLVEREHIFLGRRICLLEISDDGRPRPPLLLMVLLDCG